MTAIAFPLAAAGLAGALTVDAVRRAARHPACPLVRDRRKVAGQLAQWVAITGTATVAVGGALRLRTAGYVTIAVVASALSIGVVNIGCRIIRQ